MKFEAIRQMSHDGPLTISVDGDCMFNSVPNGSKVQIERHHIYWPGDIVIYGRGDDRLVMHRFLGYVPGRRGWYCVTRADQAKNADAPVLVNRIVGKVKRVNQQAVACSVWQRVQSFSYHCLAVARMAYRRWIINTGKS